MIPFQVYGALFEPLSHVVASSRHPSASSSCKLLSVFLGLMSSAGRACCPSRWTHHKGLASASEAPSCKPSGCCQAALSPLSHCGPGKLSFLRLCSPPQHMACPAMLKMEILRWTNTHVPVLEEKRLSFPIEGHSMHLVSFRLTHFPRGFSVFPTLYIIDLH